ncbi:putative phage tail protein [Clostridium botulinum]|uniref:putative phage tail protein n=1 Tax=Clostridium botulinum TaxID=1491 RepID=UPI001967A256|nr:putative phage tail protein [Clostridium botulinum]MBN1079259.1 DUF2313 domain-containing protein [Clostridium botulinum]
MYSINQYATTKYSENIKTLDDEIGKINLMQYMPTYYQNSKLIIELLESEAIELVKIKLHIEDLQKQLFIETATWGLKAYENLLNIPTNLNFSFEERRRIIKSKILTQGATTINSMKEIAEAFSGGEVNIIEDNLNYSFVIQFIGVKGIPVGLNCCSEVLKEIVPAHLNYSFRYTYTDWREVQKITYRSVKNKKMTWEKIKQEDFE